ncbi:MAG TPA: SDR family oxidoreductase [Verrucomicrobiae bacterium]|nr:SDR family oxidoreductase [Verrucomicrobiae bacterium]
MNKINVRKLKEKERNNMNILKNKIALITGGTSGMGAATAKRFLAEGATVVVTGSSTASAEAARKEMPGVEVLVSDAGDPHAAKLLVDHVREKHGRIDILFVNAGIARIAPIGAVDEVLFDKIFNVNLRGPYFLLKHAVSVLSDGGSIILTSSVGALRGLPGLSVYSATKAALRSLGLTLAAELAPRAIRVNTITPGGINTPIHGKMELTEEQMAGMARMSEKVLLRRKGQPEEIASAALYFASDESRFTTGTELLIDGGMTL